MCTCTLACTCVLVRAVCAFARRCVQERAISFGIGTWDVCARLLVCLLVVHRPWHWCPHSIWRLTCSYTPRPSPLPSFSPPSPSQFCVQALLHEPWSAPRLHYHPSRIRPVQLHGGQPSAASRCVGWHTHVRVILGGFALFISTAPMTTTNILEETLGGAPPAHLYVGVSAPFLTVFLDLPSRCWALSLACCQVPACCSTSRTPVCDTTVKDSQRFQQWMRTASDSCSRSCRRRTSSASCVGSTERTPSPTSHRDQCVAACGVLLAVQHLSSFSPSPRSLDFPLSHSRRMNGNRVLSARCPRADLA